MDVDLRSCLASARAATAAPRTNRSPGVRLAVIREAAGGALSGRRSRSATCDRRAAHRPTRRAPSRRPSPSGPTPGDRASWRGARRRAPRHVRATEAHPPDPAPDLDDGIDPVDSITLSPRSEPSQIARQSAALSTCVPMSRATWATSSGISSTATNSFSPTYPPGFVTRTSLPDRLCLVVHERKHRLRDHDVEAIRLEGQLAKVGDAQLDQVLDAVPPCPFPGPLDHPRRAIDPDHAAAVRPGDVGGPDADPAAHVEHLGGTFDLTQGQEPPRRREPALVLADPQLSLHVEVVGHVIPPRAAAGDRAPPRPAHVTRGPVQAGCQAPGSVLAPYVDAQRHSSRR